jgi:NAD/NADP transhydrogenase alpha subunit
VELDLSVADAEDKGGYARQQSEDFYQAQQKLMAKVVAESDVVITTAGVPGKRAPVLVTEEMVRGMPPRSVIVDVVADLGGNCALSVPGETLVRHDVVNAINASLKEQGNRIWIGFHEIALGGYGSLLFAVEILMTSQRPPNPSSRT